MLKNLDCKNLQFKTHFWCLSHLVPEVYLFEEKKSLFSYILALRGNFGTIRKGSPLATKQVIPRQNGKFFDHEKWFLTYESFSDVGES